MRNNKKSQSEIITTVLIILLVLAAIVIVWQVVSRTMKNADTSILNQENCIGLDLSVASATPQVGACSYIGAACDADTTVAGVQLPANSPLTVKYGGASNSALNCPIPTNDLGANLVCTSAWAGDPNQPAKVVVMRNAGTAKVESITPKLFINGVTSPSILETATHVRTLKALESGSVSEVVILPVVEATRVGNIEKGDKIKVAALLPGGNACGESAEITVA